jgi:hypothetical protein
LRRNNIKASAPSFKEPPWPSTTSSWEWVAPSTTYCPDHTLEPFKELGLDSQRVKKLASEL